METTKKQVDMLFEVAKLTIENKSQKTIANILNVDVSLVQGLQGTIKSGTKFKTNSYLMAIGRIEKKAFKKARLIAKMTKDGFCTSIENEKLKVLMSALTEKTDNFLKQNN